MRPRSPAEQRAEENTDQGPDHFWTIPELAVFLKKPKSWVYDNYQELFPYYRMGQAVRFDPDEIRATLRTKYRHERS